MVLIFTVPYGSRVCTIYSPNVTINDAMMDIPSGTQNVILYCICRRNNDVAVGPTRWFINGSAVTTTADGSGNPYYRNNVPSPLIIPSFTATHAGTYRCDGPSDGDTGATIELAGIAMCNFNGLIMLAFCVMVIINKTSWL